MSILRANCLSCHNDEKKKGGLRLNSRSNALKGGESGPAFIPRKSDKSLLAKVILPDSDPHMPPKKQLSEKDIATLRRWIDTGAKWDAKALAENPAANPVRFVDMPGSYQPVLALALSPDEKRLAVARANRVFIYNVSQTNHPIVAELEGHRDAVQSLAWSKDNQHLAAGSFRRIVVWDAQTLKHQLEMTNNLADRVTALQFTPDGATLVAADGEPTKSGVIHLWSVAGGKSQSTWSAHKDSIYALCLSPDGKRLATGGADKVIRLWELATQKETGKLEAHSGHVLALAFNPDGSMLASSGADKVLNFWDTTNWNQAITLNNHSAPVTALVWSAGGTNLFSACEDGVARRFTEFKVHLGEQSGGGAQERAFNKAGDILYSLAATADGKTVFAGCHDGSVYVWNADGKVTAMLSPREKQTAHTTKSEEAAGKNK